MLAAHAVAIDPGSTTTRAVWLKGSSGGLEVLNAQSFVVGEANTSLAAVVGDLRSKKVPCHSLVLGAPGQTAIAWMKG